MKWQEDEIELLRACIETGWTHKEIGILLNRSHSSIKSMALKLKLKSLNNKNLTPKLYKTKLAEENPELEVLGIFVNTRLKLLHKHKNCGYIWNLTPNNALAGYGCPQCAYSGWKPLKPSYVYCIYFPDHGFYKYGITANLKKRHTNLGQKSEIIYTRYFNTGLEAKKLEQQWSENVEHLKVNTGLLSSGNTETFYFE